MTTMNIHQRIRLVMEMVPRLAKDQYNQHHRFAYAGHEDVTETLQPAFVKAGITQFVDVEECGRYEGALFWIRVSVGWVNTDKPEDRVVVKSYAEGPPPGKGGPAPQHVGVALSYAVKNAQVKCFCLRTGDTQDAEQTMGPEPEEAPDPGWAQKIVDASTPGEVRDVAAKIMKLRGQMPAGQYAALAAKVGERMKEIKQ